MTLDDLSAGDVVIRAAYSSFNYKDALAATGAGKIIRRFPLVPGIDVAGTVAATADRRLCEGGGVLVPRSQLRGAPDGGYAGPVRAPAGRALPPPPAPS